MIMIDTMNIWTCSWQKQCWRGEWSWIVDLWRCREFNFRSQSQLLWMKYWLLGQDWSKIYVDESWYQVCALQIQTQTSSVTHSSSWTSRQTYPTTWCKIEEIIIIIVLIIVIIIIIMKFMFTMIFRIIMILMIIRGGLFQWKFSIPNWRL